MPAHLSCPAAAIGWRPLTISAALAAASAACGFAAIAVAAYAGDPSQSIAAATYALFGAGAGTVCAAVDVAFDDRAARRWPRGGRVASADPAHALPAPAPVAAAAQSASAGEAAQPA